MRRVIGGGVFALCVAVVLVGLTETSFVCAICSGLTDSDPAWHFWLCYLRDCPPPSPIG